MRITFVLPGGGRAGGIRSTVRIGNELLRKGRQVRILYRETPMSLRYAFDIARMWVRYRGVIDWISTFEGTRESFKDIHECRFEKGEVLIGMGSWAALQVSNVKGEFAARIHSLHGALPDTDRYLADALKAPMERIVVSPHLAEFVLRESGREVAGIAPNGVDLEEYSPPDDEAARTGIGSVYGKTPAKDPETFLAVFAKMAEDMPEVPQYVFGLYRRPSGLGHAHYSRHPILKTIRTYYGRSKVWICASASEGFGLPILEAMACGCAVVSTDCGGPGQIIRDGVNGFLVPVGDVEAIVDRTKTLLADEEARSRIVAEGYKTAHSYSWPRAGETFERHIVEAVRRSQSATASGRQDYGRSKH